MGLSEAFRFGPPLAIGVTNTMAHAKEWEHKKCVSRQRKDTVIEVIHYEDKCESKVVDILLAKKNESLSLSDTAILVREFAFTPAIEAALIAADIPYQVRGARPFTERFEILALRGLLHMALGSLDQVKDQQTRLNLVKALMSFPSLGLGGDQLEVAAREVAETKRISIYSEYAIKQAGEAAEGDLIYQAKLARIKRTWDYLRAQHDKLPAGQLLEYAVNELKLRFEASMRFVRRDLLMSTLLSIENFIEFAKGTGYDANDFLLYLETLSDYRNNMRNWTNAVRLTTYQQAKGLEWEHVILPGLEKGVFPQRGESLESERRLFYVAITRAKKRLTLLCSKGKESSFVTDMNIRGAIKEGGVALRALRQITYLNVSIKDEDEVKRLGARRDPENQKWYVPVGVNPDRFERWFE